MNFKFKNSTNLPTQTFVKLKKVASSSHSWPKITRMLHVHAQHFMHIENLADVQNMFTSKLLQNNI